MKNRALHQAWGWLLMSLLLWAAAAQAEEMLLPLDIGRGDARMPVYLLSRPDAAATLILLPGGDAGTGKIVDGKPTSGNFLSRTREAFFAERFNVAVVYRASDLAHLEYDYRISGAHVAEIGKVVSFAKAQWGRPVWLVGTSRGTVSAAAAAIALGESEIQGLVLTSSVTSRKTGAIASQNVRALKIPVLVVHHKYDACRVCVPQEAGRITAELKSSPVKKFVMVEGGSDPSGDPCEARHWHGFIHYESETVRVITDWIKAPAN
jgi:pimeloyl-ACP methyl ester carboxylesterase